MNKVALGEICEFINGGAWSDKEYVQKGLPVLKVSNCKPHGFSLEDINYLPIESYERYKKNKLFKGDVIIATVGSHPNLKDSAAGRSCVVNALVEGYFLNQNAVCVRSINNDVLNQLYLGYLAKYHPFQHYIQMRGRGAANQMRIAIGAIKDYEFELPDIKVQTRIANILFAYDNLIENNHKMIKLLEEAIKRVYKEWFVDLRFSGYEDTTIIEGLPEGWNREKLINLLHVQYGYAFDGKKFNSEKKGFPIIRIRNIPKAETSDYTTEEADKKYIVKNGDIIVGMDGEFHINTWVGQDAYLVQRTCKMTPINTEMRGYLFAAIVEPIKYYEKTIVGATVAHLGKKHIDSIELLFPDNVDFTVLNSMFDERLVLLNQNKKLLQARDRLLLKLMSGEIEV